VCICVHPWLNVFSQARELTASIAAACSLVSLALSLRSVHISILSIECSDHSDCLGYLQEGQNRHGMAAL
jgi:hypothetical protein